MANQISDFSVAAQDSRNPIERALDDQGAVIEDLEIALNLLAKSAQYLMQPVVPQPVMGGTQLEPMPPPSSPAVESVRAQTKILRRLSENVEALRKRFEN